MEYTYWNDKEPTTIGSSITLQDALAVVNYGKQLLVCFDEFGVDTGTDCPAPTNEVFSSFHNALYGAGFVTGDFDGPIFDRGPMHLLFIPGVATLVTQSANLATV